MMTLIGCCSVKPDPARPASTAWSQPEATTLGRKVAARLESAPGQSGFHILEYGREALLARLALADAAEKTIDCQYYIYDPDESGAFLSARLFAAADRGVRVRLLLDDNNFGNDRQAAVFDTHPNIEVRVFNPFRIRARWLRFPQYLFDFRRLVRRMHNKIFSVDGSLAILGGRNIGDNYFDLSKGGNFHDIDIMCTGPIVKDADQAFDLYWNSPYAVPLAQMASKASPERIAKMRKDIEAYLEQQEGYPDTYRMAATGWLDRVLPALCLAQGEIVWEPPEKIQEATTNTAHVVQRLATELAKACSSVTMEFGYFVPGPKGAEMMGRLVSKGVRVDIITTALEATDEPLVFSAYRRYRSDLLRAGVGIYEYRRDAAENRSRRAWKLAASSYSSLHSKVMVLDDRISWIGSFNLDPRSAELNTEIAVLVDSLELASRLMTYLGEDMDPERSYRVELAEDNSLRWKGTSGGQPVILKREPALSNWQRLRACFYGWIPWLESQL